MIILTIRTDKPEAQLALHSDDKVLTSLSWLAHRQLAETIHLKLRDALQQSNLALTDIEGVVVFEGPGSFTGLRIGISVGNALAASLNTPIVAAAGDDWAKQGVAMLQAGSNDVIAMPEYGAEVRITQQKK